MNSDLNEELAKYMQELIILLNLSIAVISFATKSRRDRFILNPFHSFWAGYIYFSVAQPWLGLHVYNNRFGYENVTLALLLFSLSGFVVAVTENIRLPILLTQAIPVANRDKQKNILIISILMITLGAFLHYSMIKAYGGFESYFFRSAIRKLEIDIPKIYNTGQDLIVFGCVVLIIYARSTKNTLLTILMIFALSIITIFYIYVGSRSRMLVIAVACLGAFYGTKYKNPRLIALLAGTFLLAFTIGFIGAYRNQFSDASFNIYEESGSDILYNSFGFLSAGSGDGISVNEDFGMAAAVIRYVPSEVNYDYGRMFSQMFLQWIPRAIWAGKYYPEGEAWSRFHAVAQTSTWVNDSGLLSGPAPTLVGKYFYNFGILGVIFGSFLTGILIKITWRFVLLQPPLTRTVAMTLCFGVGFSELNNPIYWITFWLPSAGILLASFIVLGKLRVD